MAKTRESAARRAELGPDELLGQREELQQWLDRLRSEPPDVPPHVLERVRQDYESRLGAVTELLAGHADALHAELEQAAAQLGEVEARHDALVDETAELKLREHVGELSADAARERRDELEQQTADVRATRDQLRGETQRIRDVLASIDRGPAEAPAAPQPAAELAADEADEAELRLEPEEDAVDDLVLATNPNAWDFDFGEMEILPALEALAAQEPEGETGGELDIDSSFLEELDRRIADSLVPDSRGRGAADGDQAEGGMGDGPAEDALAYGAEEEDADTAPPPGRRCPECGYTNKIDAKYCEVCDADLL